MISFRDAIEIEVPARYRENILELRDWAVVNCPSQKWVYSDRVFAFVYENEAALFALRWA